MVKASQATNSVAMHQREKFEISSPSNRLNFRAVSDLREWPPVICSDVRQGG